MKNMQEEIKTNVIENTGIEMEQVIEEVVKPIENGKGVWGKVAGGVVGVVAVAGIVIYKNKHKLEERQVNKLRKKGYTIIEPETIEADEDNVIDIQATEVK